MKIDPKQVYYLTDAGRVPPVDVLARGDVVTALGDKAISPRPYRPSRRDRFGVPEASETGQRELGGVEAADLVRELGAVAVALSTL